MWLCYLDTFFFVKQKILCFHSLYSMSSMLRYVLQLKVILVDNLPWICCVKKFLGLAHDWAAKLFILTPNLCSLKATTHIVKFWHTFAELQFSVTTLFMMTVKNIRITSWMNEWMSKWMNGTVPVN